MNRGDIVMFVDTGSYAKWFFGMIAICETSTSKSRTCRVRWIQPVKYFDSYTTSSDFGWDRFDDFGANK